MAEVGRGFDPLRLVKAVVVDTVIVICPECGESRDVMSPKGSGADNTPDVPDPKIFDDLDF